MAKTPRPVAVTTPRFIQTQATVTERNVTNETFVDRIQQAVWPKDPQGQRCWAISYVLTRDLFGSTPIAEKLELCDDLVAYINDGTIPGGEK